MKSPKNLTREDIIALVVGEEYHLHGLTTICVLTTSSGFTVTADTTAADPDTFSEEKGRQYALDLAIDKLFPFEVYAQRRAAGAFAFDAIKHQMQADPDVAWAWHCNFAMPMQDALYIPSIDANETAAKLMRHLFNVDIWAMFPDRKPVRHTDDRANPTPLGRSRMRDYFSKYIKDAIKVGLQPLGLDELPAAVKATEEMLAGEGRHHTKETASHLAKKLAAAFKAEQEADEAAVDAIKAAPEAFQVGDIVACEGERWTEGEVTNVMYGTWCTVQPNNYGPALLYGASRLKLLRRPEPKAEALEVGDIVEKNGIPGGFEVTRIHDDCECATIRQAKDTNQHKHSFIVYLKDLTRLRRPQAEPEKLQRGDVVRWLEDKTNWTVTHTSATSVRIRPDWGNETQDRWVDTSDLRFVRWPIPVESGPLTDEAGPVAGPWVDMSKADADGYVEMDMGARPGSKREFVGITIDEGFATGSSRHFRFDGETWHESASARRVIGAFVEANKRPDTDVPSPAELNAEDAPHPMGVLDASKYMLKVDGPILNGMLNTKTRITPTIGRRVWYYPDQMDPAVRSTTVILDKAQPLDAGIVFVHPDGRVNLAVMDHMGNHHRAKDVPVLMPDELPTSRDYARWMPYQAAQARG